MVIIVAPTNYGLQKNFFDMSAVETVIELVMECTLYDNLYPIRIVVGTDIEDERHVKTAHTFADFLVEGSLKEDVEVLYRGFTESEAVKLFANTYIALRVSFFNELDTYAETVCKKIQNSFWQTIKMYYKILLKLLWNPIEQEKILLWNRY